MGNENNKTQKKNQIIIKVDTWNICMEKRNKNTKRKLLGNNSN